MLPIDHRELEKGFTVEIAADPHFDATDMIHQDEMRRRMEAPAFLVALQQRGNVRAIFHFSYRVAARAITQSAELEDIPARPPADEIQCGIEVAEVLAGS